MLWKSCRIAPGSLSAANTPRVRTRTTIKFSTSRSKTSSRRCAPMAAMSPCHATGPRTWRPITNSRWTRTKAMLSGAASPSASGWSGLSRSSGGFPKRCVACSTVCTWTQTVRQVQTWRSGRKGRLRNIRKTPCAAPAGKRSSVTPAPPIRS